MTEVSAQKKSGIVVLVGRPNVGKSTLLNAVLQEEISIVTPKAQTTRDQVRGILNEERGQIVFIDTPGVHRARDGGINAYMIQEVRKALDGPDLVLYLIDPASKEAAEQALLDHLKLADAPLVMVVNKSDQRLKHPEQFAWIEKWIETCRTALEGTKCRLLGVSEISASKNVGVTELLDSIFKTMPEGEPLFHDTDILTDRPTRFVVAEMIRKQLFMKLGDELPYSCAVEIESFKENQKPITIYAMIYVERESQKGMVIGAGGKKIKEIGTGARKEIEELLGEKVFLDLRVKVMEGWTAESEKMKHLGYVLEKSKSKSGARR
jgi:GTP-binding protein Era